MRVDIVRPDDLGPDEAALWAKFQHQSPVMQSPFLSLTFARAVAQSRPGAGVAVVEDGGQIEAFLPFERGPRRVGMPIGYPMNDLQGFVGSGSPVDARRVIRRAGLRGWRFTAAPAEQAALAPHHYEGTAVGASVIDLSRGYQGYRGGLSRSFTRETARKRRALEKKRGPVSLVWNSASIDDIRQMISWKSVKYDGTRKLFADATAMQIVARLALTENTDCGGIVNVMLAGERPFAISCDLTGPGGVAGWFAAYDPDLGAFSPGTVMALAIAEEAANRGINQFDLGPGQDTYKFRLANHSYPVAGGAVWASQAEAAARQVYRKLRPQRSFH
jgi:CelD/BcsL family acetyltransferase involved in cellulose biosynthesis